MSRIAVIGLLVGTLALAVLADSVSAQTPPASINTLDQIFAALRACWVPPRLEQSRPGMEVTVRLSFKRSGEIFGRPRITFESSAASDEERLAYRIALAEALKRCTPLPFTPSLGNAVAGRLLTIHFTDNRKLRQAQLRPDR